MNRWQMCGDWAPMPMNVRGPRVKPKVSSVWTDVDGMAVEPPGTPMTRVDLDELGKEIRAKVRERSHYDRLVYDDVVSPPKSGALADFLKHVGHPPTEAQKQLMEALENSPPGILKQVIGRPPQHRTATEVMMADREPHRAVIDEALDRLDEIQR